MTDGTDTPRTTPMVGVYDESNDVRTDRTPLTLHGQRDMLPKGRERDDNTFVPRGTRRDSPGQPAGAIDGGHPDTADVRATRPDPEDNFPEPVAAEQLHQVGPTRAHRTDKPRDEREAEELAKRKSDHGSPPSPAYRKAEHPDRKERGEQDPARGEQEKKEERGSGLGEGAGKHRRDRTPGEPEVKRDPRKAAKQTEIDTEEEIDEAVEESFPASDPPAWSPGTT